MHEKEKLKKIITKRSAFIGEIMRRKMCYSHYFCFITFLSRAKGPCNTFAVFLEKDYCVFPTLLLISGEGYDGSLD